MRLRDYHLLTDENISPEVVRNLRKQGFDVVDVKESALVGMPDRELIRLAHSQNRVILTHDRDFGHLAISNLEPMVGIIFMRPGHVDAEFTIGSLNVLFRQELDLVPPFTLVARRVADDVTIRVRRL